MIEMSVGLKGAVKKVPQKTLSGTKPGGVLLFGVKLNDDEIILYFLTQRIKCIKLDKMYILIYNNTYIKENIINKTYK